MLQEDGPAGRKYKGVKEGGVTENTSYYIFQQSGSGAFEAFPIEVSRRLYRLFLIPTGLLYISFARC